MPHHLALLVAIADPRWSGTPRRFRRRSVGLPTGGGAGPAAGSGGGAEITARGGLALDVPPEALNIAVVNRYLEVKRRGIL
jgi:hypothetical protein